MDLVVHPRTEQALKQQLTSNAHAVLLIGPKGTGKYSLALNFAAQRHDIASAKVLESPFVMMLAADKTKHIPIESVRSLEHFLSLRPPKEQVRTILIDDAGALTIDAQNALLKMLEEPPERTVFILTVDSTTSLLPTIRSRTIQTHVIRPSSHDIRQFFTAAGHDETAINRAQLMSGGLPGLMHAVLSSDTEHPLLQAAQVARECIQKSTYERLAMVDMLAKDRELSDGVLTILQQMAHVSLASSNANPIWKPLLQEAYEAQQLLRQNAQPKLVLTNLMLRLAI